MAKVIDAILRLKDQFSPVMHQVSKSASEHTQIQKRLSRSLENTKKQFAAMSSGAMIGGAALAGALGAAIKANEELGKSIAQLNAVGAMSGQSMEGMRGKIEETAKAAHMAQSDVAGLFLAAKRAGLDAAQVEGTVAAAINYAKVAGMDKAEATKNLAQITRAWTLTEKDQVAAMDQAAAVASRSGQDLGQLQTTLAGMSEHAAHAGISFSDLSTTLGYMQGNMHMTSEQASGAINGMFSVIEGGSPKASKALANIGMSTQELAESVKNNGMAAAMADVAQRVAAQGGDVEGTLKKITGSTEGARLAMQLMSADGMDNFQDLAGAVQNSAGTMQKGLDVLGKSVGVQLANAKQDLLTEFQNMVADIMPILKVTTQFTAQLLKAFLQLPGPVKVVIESIGGLVLAGMAVSMVMGTVGVAVINGLQAINQIDPVLGKLKTGILGIGSAISKAGAFLAANPLVLAIVGIVALAAALVYAYNHCEKFRNIVDKTSTRIAAVAGPAMQRVQATVISVWTKITSFVSGKIAELQAFYSAHQEQIDAILAAVGAAFSMACDLIGTYIGGFVAVFGDQISMLINVAMDLISFIGNVFTGDWSAAWKNIEHIFVDIFNGIKNIFNDVISTISSALDRIIGKSSDAKAAAADAQAAGENPGHNASGTQYWRGGLTYLHEQGGELVDLPRGSRVYPHDTSLQMEYQRGQREAAAEFGGGNITIAKLADSIVVHDKRDIDELANELIFKIKAYSINSMAGAI